MALIRAQVRLSYFSGLPEDVVTNTLYFITGGVPATPAELDDIAARIESAYSEWGPWLGAPLRRGTDLSEIRMYDMADPEPRVPVYTHVWTLPAASAATCLPLECSAVLSFHAAYTSGVPNARRRGRIYLGPLIASASASGTASTFPQVVSTLVTDIVAGAVLLGTDVTEVVTWAQYSPTTGLASPVEGGWVDNEFDTQRRREARATTRTTWLAPV